MEPGLNGGQSGTVPKNKSKPIPQPSVRQLVAHAANYHFEQVPEQERRRKPSSTQSEAESEGLRFVRQPSSPGNLVDNDNGELSWGLNLSHSDLSGPPSRQSLRGTRNRSNWMSGETSGHNETNGGRPVAPPNRNQVVNKLTQIQNYILQTEAIMSDLKASDSAGCHAQHEKLGTLLADLRDSEVKLTDILAGMSQADTKLEQLIDEAPEVQRALLNGDGPTEEELLRRADDSRRKVEDLERRKNELLALQHHAQRQLAEAEAEQTRLVQRAANFNPDLPASLENDLQNINDRIRNVGRLFQATQNRISSTPAEHPDEDQAEAELSDTETVYQNMREKVSKLDAMKSELSQLKAVMASFKQDQEVASDDGSRRSKSRDREPSANKMHQQISEMLETLKNLRDTEVEVTLPTRLSEDVTVETMQQMRRELEDHKTAMKLKRDRLIEVRNHLVSLVDGSSSPEDSESEPPSLLPVNMTSTPRIGDDDDSASRSGRKSQENAQYAPQVPPPRSQRSGWTPSSPASGSVRQEPHGGRKKESRSSQSSRGHNGPADWSPDLMNSQAMFQTQSQLEESANLCEHMFQESLGQRRCDELTNILYSQQQQLTRTVSQCCKLIWMQQRQINELRNALLLQQSSQLQSVPPRPMSAQPQPQQSSGAFALLNPSLFPQVPPTDFAPANHQPVKSADGFYQPMGFPVNPRSLPTQNQPTNLEQFLRDDPNPSRFMNYHSLPHAMPCFDLGEITPSGALNNQVPPGNRANNYWDNFRSYSRQNLLSTSKSNEDSDPLRRSSSSSRSAVAANQERAPLCTAIVPPNNQTNHPVLQVYPLREAGSQSTSGATSGSSNHGHVARSRSVEPQSLRNFNGTKNKCEAPGRKEEVSDERVNRVRNNVGMGVRNRVDPEPPAEPEPDASQRANNKRQRPGNLNNRSDINNGMFSVLRDNVYQEVTSFIRANETRPNFLIQLFRDLQLVTSDPQRHRALQSLQDIVTTNNIFQEARNNIRVNENRSNLNRNPYPLPPDERVEILFDQLRENQNTIRQNLGSAPLEPVGSNLENPNISNIRDLGNTRNNIDHDRIRSYVEGNLCNESSRLKNPNLSNILGNLRESLVETMNPKNVYLSLYDNVVEDLRIRTVDMTQHPSYVVEDRPPRLDHDSVMYVVDNDMGDMIDGQCRRNTNHFLNPIESDESGLELEGAVGGALWKRGIHICDRNNARATEQESSSIREAMEWPTNENPFSMFAVAVPPDDADLAEADQTRNGENSGAESESDYNYRATVVLHPRAFQPAESVVPRNSCPVSHPTESEESVFAEAGAPLDPNENLVSSESNNNGPKTLNIKNLRPRTCGSLESGESRQMTENRPMMDIAGALEHLQAYRQEEDDMVHSRGQVHPEVEADWELEGGLDQVPSRLVEKRDPSGGDPT